MNLPRTLRTVALAAALTSGIGASATADETSAAPPLVSLDDAALLERLWIERAADASAFAAPFLAAVPAARLREVFEGAARAFGEPESVVPGTAPDRHRLLTATHEVPIDLVRDAEGRIAGLLLHPPVLRGASLDEALAALDAPGTAASWLLTRDGESVSARAPSRRQAIGSAFKLWVLDAYRVAVESGRVRRDDVTRLDAAHRSHPSGILHEAPDGMPVTLETLATLMMSMSDNTATDALVRVLGREAVEALSPFDPLLLTGELFRLRADPALERRYAGGDADERRAVLDALAGTALPPLASGLPAPLPGAEWYASPRELCAVIGRVADEPATSVATGLVDRAGWASVAAKGGSEPGVLNATARLVADDGTVWCLAVTWNGEPDGDGRPRELDELALVSSLASVVAGLVDR